MTDTTETPVLTQEQKMQNVKVNLNSTLATLHNNLFGFVSGLPITDDQKKFAQANLIQALHWAQDGIEALEFEVVDSPELPAANDCDQSAENDVNQPEGEAQC